jgi:hypothetical protein
MVTLNHIFTVMRAPNGTTIKLLAEYHYKTFAEKQQCDEYINNPNVNNVLLENYKPTYFGLIMYNFSKKCITLYEKVFGNNNFRSSVFDAYNSGKQWHDLEDGNKANIANDTDDIILIVYIGSLITLLKFPKIGLSLILLLGCLSIKDIMLTHIINKFDYKTQKKISYYTLFKRHLYGRDKIMAHNIMNYVSTKGRSEDTPLCIYGKNHNAVISYYLLKNGYRLIGYPIKF